LNNKSLIDLPLVVVEVAEEVEEVVVGAL